MPKKKKRDRGSGNEEAEMDMTPMIDVTFLLLIFFLCLEFKTLEGKLASNLPKDVGVNTTPAEPIEKLDIRIELVKWGEEKHEHNNPAYRYDLIGHKVKWYVGATPIKTMDALEKLLRKEAKNKVKDSEGKLKRKPITIKTGPGVVYQDVTQLIDLARDAKFEEITFGGGEGSRKGSYRPGPGTKSR